MKTRILTLLSAIVLLALPLAPAQAGGDAQASGGATTTYTVQRGDTWSSLAARYGVSISRLLATNDVQATFGIGGQAGKQLWLYPGEQVLLPLGLGFTPSRVNPFLYSVRPGESLSQIAYRFEQSLYHLRLANGLDQTENAIAPGTTLLMPAGPHYHRLSGNESLADVAALYGVTPEYLLRFNNSGIAPGQDILIPIQYDRPFTPMGAVEQGSGGAGVQGSNTASEQVRNQPSTGVAGEGGKLEFRWFGVNRAIPDAAAGTVKLVLVAEFRGGRAPLALTIGGLTIPVRGPFLKTDNGETWSNLEFDWQSFCNDAFVLPGTLSSADGQTAFTANTIGPFSCD